jgi:hypothetical protein
MISRFNMPAVLAAFSRVETAPESDRIAIKNESRPAL